MSKQNRKTQILQAVRFEVWKTRFGNDMTPRKCQCCNLNEISITNFDCGHIISVKNGGLIHLDNLIPLCGSCNRSIGSCNVHEHVKLSGVDWNIVKKTLGGKWSDDDIKLEQNCGWLCCFSHPVLKNIYYVVTTLNDPSDEVKIVNQYYSRPFRIEFAKKN